MAALPYMQLYVAEYLADTVHLTTEEHGAYLLLIMNYWQRGKPLPDSNERLASVARLSNERWQNVRTTLEEFFEIRDGFWVHKRIERDLEAVKRKCDGAQKAGLASGKSRKEKTSNRRSTNVGTPVKRTLNDIRTEQIRTEQNNKEELLPEMVAQAVMDRSRIAGMGLGAALHRIAKLAGEDGEDMAELADRMVKAWDDFNLAKPKLKYFWGAEKFFGEGYWESPDGWPWKDELVTNMPREPGIWTGQQPQWTDEEVEEIRKHIEAKKAGKK